MKLDSLESQWEHSSTNTFYVSFSDLMVLLCAFFVMMLGMSKVDVGSFEKIRSGITGQTEGTLVELAEVLQKIAEGPPAVDGVTVRLAEDGVRLDLESAALFESGSATLRPDALEPLTPLLAEIIGTSYTVDIEGHTDDRAFYRRRGDVVDTNWSLSGRRASSVVHHLLEFGFDDDRLRIVGYASNRPKVAVKNVAGDELEKARGENRRVSLLVR